MIYRHYNKISFLLILLFSIFIIAHSTSFASSEYHNFKLNNSNGNLIDTADYNDKILVLEWINPDCPFVQRHGKEKTMKTLSEKYGKEVVWLGINSTHYMTAKDNSKWVSENNLNYPVLDDSEGKVGKLYDAKTTPHMYILDTGKSSVLYEGAIDDDPRGNKKPEERTNYVDNALSEIASGKKVSVSESKPYGCSVKYK